ncbi:hypothetical protein EHP00_2008 [Ecytonucleospora hepatopenaei]|uniref:Uncharacterized protein n=1 Tax=Ecytonucleospora hepatopenaei TaxID=646526 RepID=A0A1W0E7L6_9MICR|nr:hypothetical protein EHP00_2008 [Ecytonucleospora hepatopenaei]
MDDNEFYNCLHKLNNLYDILLDTIHNIDDNTNNNIIDNNTNIDYLDDNDLKCAKQFKNTIDDIYKIINK